MQALTGTHPEMYEGEVRDVVWRRVLDAGDACEHLELHDGSRALAAGCMWCGRRGAGSLERTSPILKMQPPRHTGVGYASIARGYHGRGISDVQVGASTASIESSWCARNRS